MTSKHHLNKLFNDILKKVDLVRFSKAEIIVELAKY